MWPWQMPDAASSSDLPRWRGTSVRLQLRMRWHPYKIPDGASAPGSCYLPGLCLWDKCRHLLTKVQSSFSFWLYHHQFVFSFMKGSKKFYILCFYEGTVRYMSLLCPLFLWKILSIFFSFIGLFLNKCSYTLNYTLPSLLRGPASLLGTLVKDLSCLEDSYFFHLGNHLSHLDYLSLYPVGITFNHQS